MNVTAGSGNVWALEGWTQDRQCACDVTLKSIFATIVAVEKRYLLQIQSVCL